jgi:hypothetical protein
MRKQGVGGKDEEDEAAWKGVSMSQFLKGYSEEDAIYDNLPSL